LLFYENEKIEKIELYQVPRTTQIISVHVRIRDHLWYHAGTLYSVYTNTMQT